MDVFKVTPAPYLTEAKAGVWLLLVMFCAAAAHPSLAELIQLKDDHLKGCAHREMLQVVTTQPDPPNPQYPCSSEGQANDFIYMTAVSKCPKDAFYISFVIFGPEFGAGDVTWIAGADGSPVEGVTQHAWRGAYYNGINHTANQGIRIAVSRASDGKIITPKGVKADGSFYDISNTTKRACQLFTLGSNPLRFAFFRGRASADATRVLWDNFGSNEYRATIPKDGIACEQYKDEGGSLGRSVSVGRMVDTYLPGSCLFGIDDCSS